LLFLRLKQLYDKFDDVVASGRMIAKVSDTTDGSASSSIVNGKRKKKENSIMLSTEDTINVSLARHLVYCSSTFARVYIYYSYTFFLCTRRNSLSAPSGFFFSFKHLMYM
jgi:hypothetical protein